MFQDEGGPHQAVAHGNALNKRRHVHREAVAHCGHTMATFVEAQAPFDAIENGTHTGIPVWQQSGGNVEIEEDEET